MVRGPALPKSLLTARVDVFFKSLNITKTINIFLAHFPILKKLQIFLVLLDIMHAASFIQRVVFD